MSETMTLPVTTYVYGMGAEQRVPPVYVLLQERSTTARALIAEHVRSEVQRTRQSRLNSLALHYILADDPRLEPSAAVDLDIDAEIARACTALASRRYLLVVDGAAVAELDAPLALTERSQVHFVRLLPLIGG
jgi:hypothetical protein